MKPKKILHVTNRAERYDGKKFYNLPFKMNHGFVRNGHNVYWFSDRDVAKTASLIPSSKFGRAACNKKFIELCKWFRPDVLALCHANILTVETLETVGKMLPGLRVFQYNIDGLYIESNVRYIQSKSHFVKYTFMTSAGSALNEVGTPDAPACFIPNPVDASIDIYRNWELTDFHYDLLFVGKRSDWIDPESLRALAFKLLPDDPSGLRVLMSNSLWGSEMMAAIGASRMAVCFNQVPPGEQKGDGGKLYLSSSDRISSCMGNGLLAFTDKSFALAELYGSDALVEVASYDDFREQALFYVANDAARIEVAKKGYEISHREFNEKLVTRYMLERVFEEKLTHPYAWPVDLYTGQS